MKDKYLNDCTELQKCSILLECSCSENEMRSTLTKHHLKFREDSYQNVAMNIALLIVSYIHFFIKISDRLYARPRSSDVTF